MFQKSKILLANKNYVCYMQPMTQRNNHHVILVDMTGYFLCGVRQKIGDGETGHIHFFVYASINNVPKMLEDKQIEHLFSVLTYAIVGFFDQTVAVLDMKDQVTLRLSKHCSLENHSLEYGELIGNNAPIMPMKIKNSQITNFRLEVYVAGMPANYYDVSVEEARNVNSPFFVYNHILNNKLSLQQFLVLNQDEIKLGVTQYLVERRVSLTDEFITLGKQLAVLKQIH